ncbi:MAG TPA: hypothetical protein VGL58_00045 [Caulobacteraceae bacterium]
MRKLAPLLALACLLPSLAQAAPNPILGSWRFASTNQASGAAGCQTSFVFSATAATITTPPSSVIPAGSTRTMAVSYVTASPSFVTVMTDGTYVNYSFADANHMFTQDAWGTCNYVRAG